MNTINTKEKQIKLKTAQINNALGVFILFFGVVVIVAMIFTNTFVQQMTDLVAGLVLCGIGGGMIFKARKTIKALNMNDNNYV
jgi:putative Mn2+ efflux pump MntP